MCLRRLGSWAEADEVTSLVFFEAWRNAARARFVDDTVLPWLLAIAANLARNQTRARRRWADLLTRLPPPAAEPDLADAVVDSLTADALTKTISRCLSELDSHDQDVLVPCDLGEAGYGEAGTCESVGLTAEATH